MSGVGVDDALGLRKAPREQACVGDRRHDVQAAGCNQDRLVYPIQFVEHALPRPQPERAGGCHLGGWVAGGMVKLLYGW